MPRLSLSKSVLFFIIIGCYATSLIAQLDSLPDGKVVFLRLDEVTNKYQIYKLNLDGTGLTQLTFEENVNEVPRWSPDGEKIAFVQSTYADQSQVMMMDADGGNVKGISTYWAYVEAPEWSPDGTMLVYLRLGGIYIADTSSINGSMEQLILPYGNNPQWSIDGTKILFNSGYLADSLGISQGNFFSIEIETEEIGQFTINAIDDEEYGHLSPDENNIIFTAGNYTQEVRIFLTDLSVSFIDTLTGSEIDLEPRWSNDGSKIVFMRKVGGYFTIFTMNPDGMDLVKLTDPPAGPHYGDLFPDLYIDTSTISIRSYPISDNPREFFLSQNYPNPFNLKTLIVYQIPVDEWVKLTIHNIAGNEVNRLVDNLKSKGEHSILWDGRNKNGNPIPSGIYFCRIQAGSLSATKKLLLIK